MKIRIDGIEYELDSDAARQAIDKAIEKRDGDAEASTKKLDELQGKFDAVTKERDDLKKKLDEASDPKRIDGLVNARADLVAKCRPILGEEEKLDGLKTREIHVKTLKKLDDKFDDTDKSDAYVEGVFDQSVKGHVAEDRSDGLGAALRSTPANRSDGKGNDKGNGQDEIDHFDAGAAEKRMLKRNSEDWKKGLEA